MERARLQQPRAASYQGDGAAFMVVVGPGMAYEVLQLAGDGIAAALGQHVAGADDVAQAWVLALCDRGWPGDAELARELEAALGRRPPTELTGLSVDLEELSELLEAGMGEDGGYVDLATGEVWPHLAVEYARESEDEPPNFGDRKRWLYAGPEGSEEGYRDMQAFIAETDDPGRADRLAIAIEGSGAIRRFRNTLARWPDDEERWYRFSDERRHGRARQWLADSGYRVIPRSQRADP